MQSHINAINLFNQVSDAFVVLVDSWPVWRAIPYSRPAAFWPGFKVAILEIEKETSLESISYFGSQSVSGSEAEEFIFEHTILI